MALSQKELADLSARENAAYLGTGTKHAASKLNVYGNSDPKVSPFLKAWIAQPDEKSEISACVVGLIGQGTSRSLQANWNSPFEQSNLGGMFEKVGGLIQVMTEKTSITTLSSTQVWEGNKPNSFQIVLSFYAISNALKEVMYPLRELERMMGPDILAGETPASNSTAEQILSMIKSAKPGGRIPLPVILNIGRHMIIPNCVIESMSVPLDKERTKEGYLVRADVTLSISTKVMLNKANIGTTWPG